MDPSAHSERLLDLLYGELTPEEEAELRRAIDEDEELAEQWAQLRRDRREVRRHIPPPEQVSPAISEAILEAAAENTSSGPTRRSGGGTAPTRGFWSTAISSSRARAMASAAVMLLGSAVILALLFDSPFGADPHLEDHLPMRGTGPSSAQQSYDEEAVAAAPEETSPLEAYAYDSDDRGIDEEHEPFDLGEREMARLEEQSESIGAEPRPAPRATRQAPSPTAGQRPQAPEAPLLDSLSDGIDLDDDHSAGYGALGGVGRVEERTEDNRPLRRKRSRAASRTSSVSTGSATGASSAPTDDPALHALDDTSGAADIDAESVAEAEPSPTPQVGTRGEGMELAATAEEESSDAEDEEESADDEEQDELAEAQEDRSEQALELLESAETAQEGGDMDAAQYYLDQLEEEDLADELESSERDRAVRVRRSLQRQEAEPPPAAAPPPADVLPTSE